MQTDLEQNGNGKRILIAEDSPTQAERLKYLLEKNGFATTITADGEAAFQAVAAEPPTLIISDVVMPISDGFTLCKRIKADERLRHIPVILVTELSQPDDVILGLECGADNFIQKPYHEKDLLQRIQYLLTNRALRERDRFQAGIQIDLRGKRHFITAERQQILDLLISMYEEAVNLTSSLRNSLQSLHGLYRTAVELNECRSEQEILDSALSHLIELSGIASAWVFLCDDEGNNRLAAERNLPCPLTVASENVSVCNCWRKCTDHDFSDLAENVVCSRTLPAGAGREGAWYHACAPLRVGDDLLGVLNAATSDFDEMPEDTLKVVSAIGHQMGLALERVRLVRQLEDTVQARTTALRKTETWFRGVFEAQADAVFVLSSTGKVLEANQSAGEMFGCNASHFEAEWLHGAHLDEDQYRRFKEYMQCALETEDHVQFECELRRGNAEVFPADCTISRLVNPAGELLGSVLVIRDESHKRRAAEALEAMREQFHQAQRMESIGLLAAGIAHDMNNILAVVNGYTDLAMCELDAESGLRADLELVREAGSRGSRLVNQILAFGRRQVLAATVRDVNQIIAEFEKMTRRMLGEDIEFRLMLGPDVKPVVVDEAQFEQILMNLAVNARDAMPDGGVLTIETSNTYLDEHYANSHFDVSPGEFVLITVSDTGHGMDADTQKRVFEPFFTTKPAGKGTGLGLATVFGIIKQHGGYVWVYSEPGRGTAFKLYLPVAERRVEEDVVRAGDAEPKAGTGTILVVEDDPAVRELIRRILTRQGYSVHDAESPEAALAWVEENPAGIDLLVTDVIMPGMDGRALFEKLRQKQSDLRVLYSSGYTHDTISRHGILEEGVHYLPKPFTTQTLLDKVAQALR